MKILAIRQEGTESTGAMLFVDLQTQGRYGAITTTFELDIHTGAIKNSYAMGVKLRREETYTEHMLLEEAFKYFLDKGPTGVHGYVATPAA